MIGMAGYYLLNRTQEATHWVEHTAFAISHLEKLQATLVETESAGRAFLVTGSQDFRDTFASRLMEIDNDVRQFRAFTADNPAQQAHVASIEQPINRRFAYLEGQVERRAAGGFEALQAAAISEGAAEMVLIVETIKKMKDVERRLLAERVEMRQQNNKAVQISLISTIAIAIVLLTAIFGYMHRLWRKRREAETAALHLAQHDTLTGLPNRRLLTDRIHMSIENAKRYKTSIAVLCLDLDGFKHVNDTWGHDCGDVLLQQVGERLRKAVRSTDTVARTGGDEFVVVLAQLPLPAHSAFVASKIIKVVSEPYDLGNKREAIVGTSVGIALCPLHGATQNELLKHADEALYEAKRLGKGRYFLAPLRAEPVAVA